MKLREIEDRVKEKYPYVSRPENKQQESWYNHQLDTKRSIYIAAFTDCLSLIGNTESGETTISRLYDEPPANKAELVILFNLGVEYGRENATHVTIGGVMAIIDCAEYMFDLSIHQVAALKEKIEALLPPPVINKGDKI